MFLTYKSFYLKNQLFIRKWFLFLSCVFIFHNIVLTANTMEENHIKSKTTFNYLTLNSGFIYSHFDTFPPGWLQNFFSRIMRKKKTLPSYEIKNNIFPHNEFIKKKSPCQIDFDGFDLHVGESQKRFSYETLFTFSHKEIRNRYPGKDMLHTMVRVIERNNEKIDLTLKFIWNAENPQRFYGNFRNKHPLEIKLMDGDVITLYNRTSGTWVQRDDIPVHQLDFKRMDGDVITLYPGAGGPIVQRDDIPVHQLDFKRMLVSEISIESLRIFCIPYKFERQINFFIIPFYNSYHGMKHILPGISISDFLV